VGLPEIGEKQVDDCFLVDGNVGCCHDSTQPSSHGVAIGSWWRDGGSEIDAVGLGGRGRVPFLAGEAKWSARVNAARIKAALIAKAAALTPQPESLRYVVCGREQVERADPATLTVTAADISGP
jgi:hypothetical protein